MNLKNISIRWTALLMALLLSLSSMIVPAAASEKFCTLTIQAEGDGILTIQHEKENTAVCQDSKTLQISVPSEISIQSDLKPAAFYIDGKEAAMPQTMTIDQNTSLKAVFAAENEAEKPVQPSKEDAGKTDETKKSQPLTESEQKGEEQNPEPSSSRQENAEPKASEKSAAQAEEKNQPKPAASDDKKSGEGPDDPIWTVPYHEPEQGAPYTGSLVHVSSFQQLTAVSMPWGGSITNGIWTLSNGQTAFCGDGLANPPTVSSIPTSEPVLTENQDVRKALYYGYAGPANQLGSLNANQQIIVTNELVSIAWTGKAISNSSSNGYHWQHGISGWYSNIMKLPQPPASFKAYYVPFQPANVPSWSGSTATQPLFYGTFEEEQGSLRIRKSSSLPDLTMQNPNYSLENAQFGVYQTKENAQNDTDRLGTLTIGANGLSNELTGLKAGSTVWIKETAAPQGYALSSEIYKAQIENGTAVEVSAEDIPLYISTLLAIQKTSTAGETGLSLQGAQYEVRYWKDPASSQPADRTWVFAADQNGTIDFSKPEQKISGDALFQDAQGRVVWPLGKISVREVQAPAGFIASPNTYEGTIAAEGQNAILSWKETPDYSYSPQQGVITSLEMPILGTVEIKKESKNSKDDPSRLKGAEFTLYNASKQPVWFDANLDGKADQKEMIHPDQAVCTLITDASARAALPARSLGYGSYRISETKAPAGFDLNREFNQTFTIDQDNQILTFVCTDTPIAIETSAHASNGTQEVQQGSQVKIIDTVLLHNLDVQKTYYLKGWLTDARTGEPLLSAQGKPIEVISDPFQPAASGETKDMEFVFDASALAGKSLTVFEELYSVENESDAQGQQQSVLQAEHKEKNDANQTVHVIDLKTRASSSDGSSTSSRKEITIEDEVSYTGLQPGKEYEVRGTLMNKQTGKPLLDAAGNPIAASQTFTPVKPDGTIKMTFKFDGSHLEDIETVVFESLYFQKTEIAVHADLNDKDQTIALTSRKLSLIKTDPSGKTIKNADFTFTLYEDPACTKEIQTLHADVKTGEIHMEGLHAGDVFYLKETKAPQGYVISDAVYAIRVEEDGIYGSKGENPSQKLEEENGWSILKAVNQPVPSQPAKPSKPSKPSSDHVSTAAASNAAAISLTGIAAASLLAAGICRRKKKQNDGLNDRS